MKYFSDMKDDLPFDGTEVVAAAKPTFVTAIRQTSEFTEQCKKCSGSGKVTYGYTFLRTGACFACKGAGYKAFRSSTEQRAAAREKRVKRAEVQQNEKLAAWKAANQQEAAWLEAAAARGFEFAMSLSSSLVRWGALTDGQMSAVRRCMARDAERTASRPERKVERLEKLHTVMQKHSAFYAGDLTLSRRNGDQLVWIKHAGAETVLGKIDNGVLSLWNRPGVDHAVVRTLLEEFEANPLVAAVKYGKLSGRCCSCGRDLTNEGSIEAGIGPVCAAKF